jgi:hypothetical protein
MAATRPVQMATMETERSTRQQKYHGAGTIS